MRAYTEWQGEFCSMAMYSIFPSSVQAGYFYFRIISLLILRDSSNSDARKHSSHVEKNVSSVSSGLFQKSAVKMVLVLHLDVLG